MNPIVGIGELLWDVYPDGRKVAGGAPFNFAFHCHQLGHDAVIVSRVGDDDLGRELRGEVRRLGLSDEYIQADREHPTGTVRVTLDEHKVPTYTITENVAWDSIGWNERLEELASAAVAVCFGTLAQRQPTSRETVHTMLAAAKTAIKVFDVNLRTLPGWEEIVRGSLPLCSWVKLNIEELKRLRDGTGLGNPKPRGPDERYFLNGRDLQELEIVTFGRNGCRITDGKGTVRELAPPAEVVDTVGAGDAFTAAMVCLHLEGRPLRDCARFANHYAARVCEHQGATPAINRAEVERAAFGSP